MRFSLHQTLAIISLLALPALSPAKAQDLPGDVAAGRHLAEAWCATCHQVNPAGKRPAIGAPSFPDIANLSSTTALALNVFLRTSHDVMPNYQMRREDADDVVAYILSLKGR
jgi:mono/diheme cytochrome c family protein